VSVVGTTESPVDVLRGEIRKDTYARSTFEGTRRKAARHGAMGSTIRATKPARR
jgi:hypothetical protein